MTNPIIINGSLAYDTILNHPDPFSKSISKNNIENINVAFGISDKSEELGGTGGNIIYNCHLLSLPCYIFTNIGKDGDKYLTHLNNLSSVNQYFLNQDKNTDCAHAYLISDKNNQQIIGFFPGVLIKQYSFMNKENEILSLIKNHQAIFPDTDEFIFHLAPENPHNTVKNAEFCIKNKQLFFFDPGQSTPYLINNFGFLKENNNKKHHENIMKYGESVFDNTKICLEDILLSAKVIFVNEYERGLLDEYFKKYYGLSCQNFIAEMKDVFFKTLNFSIKQSAILKHPETLLVNTLGGKGSLLSMIGLKKIEEELYPVIKTEKIVDSTGCGDAFRAGFLLGFSNQKDIHTCMTLGSIMGSLAIENQGGQNHHTSVSQVNEILEREIEKNRHKKVKIKCI